MHETNKGALPENTSTDNILINPTSDENERTKMQDESDEVNVFGDIPIFTGDDSEPENSFPTF